MTTKAEVTIKAPDLRTAEFGIKGIAPYVQNKFSAKAREMMKAKQEAGSTAKKGQKREPKDFQAAYEGALHKAHDGWYGIPATAFRSALISACRLCGFTMTRAKLSVFVEPDGFDADDATPLVRITSGEPLYTELPARNESGVVDIRARPLWNPGWEAKVRLTYDADQFTLDDLANLLLRAGRQVGVGEGRPDSPNSCGMGWGLFEIMKG